MSQASIQQQQNDHRKKLISIIMNKGSGHRTPEAEPIHELLVNYFTKHGFDVQLHLAEQITDCP